MLSKNGCPSLLVTFFHLDLRKPPISCVSGLDLQEEPISDETLHIVLTGVQS